MRLLRVFIAHELLTQFRSKRFLGCALAYVVGCSVPAGIIHFFASRAQYVVAASAFASAVDAVQPLATTLLAAVLCVDAISRERDEGSLAVVSLAPVSAAGYVIRRWIAMVIVLIPVTIAPRIIAAGITAHSTGTADGLEWLAYGWLVRALPSLVIISALSMALGTITGRAVVALIFGFCLFTVFLGIANDLLAYAHRQLDGPATLFIFNEQTFAGYFWALRGWGPPPLPTVAGYPLGRELQETAWSALLALAVAAMLFGISCLYLRRTRPDLKPWRIGETDRLRSMKRMFNRIREEYKPDGGREPADRVALAIMVIAAIAIITFLLQRQDAMASLAAKRYASELRGPHHMAQSVALASIDVKGAIENDGELASTATLALRNDGHEPQSHLGFSLNAYVGIDEVRASRGSARVDRLWHRVGVALDPPLAPRESRTFTFTLRGTPGTHDFALPYAQSFRTAWRRYAKGTTAIELSDLSRSTWHPRVNEMRVLLLPGDIAPLPRYTPWTPRKEARFEEGPFLEEEVRPVTNIRVSLRIPRAMTAADACGAVAKATLESRCAMPLHDYRLLGSHLTIAELAPGIRFAHFPAHASLVKTHGPGLAAAISVARKAWPSLRIEPRAVFVEEPTSWGDLDQRYGEPRLIASAGMMHAVPEPLMIRLRPLDGGRIAASLIRGGLMRARRVEPREQQLFTELYRILAATRTGAESIDAFIPPMGMARPERLPLLKTAYQTGRLRAVLADIEARVGADRVTQAVDDFLARPGTGSMRELIDLIEIRGGVSLDRVWTDYFEGDALPRLTLADVKFARRGDAWEVSGILRNEDKGEVFCPVVLRTAFGTVRTIVHIDSKQSVPFVLHTAHEPRTLQLDPEKTAYRFGAIGTVDSVDYRGGE